MKKATLFLLILLLFTGCAGQEAKNNTLWVVTELSNSDGMNYQADVIANRMMEKYPGLEIKLDILPTDAGEREIKLKHLRTQIMSGKGPDVYLLPTGTKLISDEPQRDDNIPIEPLFVDVQQAMRNGVFLDISEYYVLNEALKQEVMEAGVLEGKRLVLPLRFQVPVVYTRPDLCQEYGITPEVLESDFLTLARFILSHEDAETAAIGLKFPEKAGVIWNCLDYGKGEVLVTRLQIAEYMRLYQQQKSIATESTQIMYEKWDYQRRYMHFNASFPGTRNPYTGEEHSEYSDLEWDQRMGDYAWPKRGEFTHECFNLLSEYTSNLYHWSTSDIPIYTGYLSDVLETLGVTKITAQEIVLYPLRAAGGSVTASITYWGAVGSSCADSNLAYEFLIQFLEEEFQWDSYRPRGNKKGAWFTWDHDPQFFRTVEDSLPVRTMGCVEPLWDNLQYQVLLYYNSAVPETIKCKKAIQNTVITAEEVPELNWKIDRAYFPVDIEESLSLAGALEKLNNPDGTPTDVNIEELAQEVYQNLWWHLAEG